MEITISVPELERFRRHVNFDRIVARPFREGIEQLTIYIQGRARVYAKPHGGDRGELARSVQVSPLASPGIGLPAKVFTNKLYAIPAEFGRRPGRMPPVSEIADWLRRHGEDPALGFIVARGIGRRGTRGIFYMRRAAENGRRQAPTIMQGVATKIELNWRSSR